MGERRRHFARFSVQHPKCCLCGGGAATEEIDHLPPKIMFLGSQLPAGADVEFPACKDCNRASRQYDQISAMIAMTSPLDAREDQRQHFLKTVRGVRNNARAAIGEMNRGFAGWRHFAKEFANQTGLDSRATVLGPLSRKAVFVLTAKLGLGYYYRMTGRILPCKGAVVVDMITNADLLRYEIPDRYKLATEFRPLSQHDSTDQFLFRYAISETENWGLFQFALHLNVMLVAMVVEDAKQHPVKANDQRTFIPGFLKLLRDPEPDFYTSRSFATDA